MVPAVPEKFPAAVKSPATENVDDVVAEPAAIVRSSNTMLLPVIVFPADAVVIENIPAPPVVCVNEPPPEVENAVQTLMVVAAFTVVPFPVTISVPKVFDPLPDHAELEPVDVIVLPHPLNVPLLVQLPPNE